ncbi:hypothetical protein [Paenibacillus endoradicis]|uniref:hypothetical protein n=1 Tax=Paenibacillus endoradicis TaxID=2972487 RepID=UPI0021592FCB|nr:hypothetical protein [Paenibacillus endoradicis]MCR8656915.1 hypothetical protein [Paenibacillus endoradicis]
MSANVQKQLLPVIPTTKNYWLVRTQGGKYYDDYKRNGFIAINWNEITISDIVDLSITDLARTVKEKYPDKQGQGRTANQLRVFSKVIKKGDAVIITSHSSNKLTIGQIIEDEPFVDVINDQLLEENNKLCPYHKRKKVKWGPTYNKYEIDIELFKMLQHAQQTISSANDYADAIESLTHNFYTKGNEAYLALRVKKDGKIPMSEFFPMGTEILKLASSFNEFSSTIKIDIDDIETKINVNSPGKIKLKGTIATITIVGLLLVGLTGGKFTINTPEKLGGLNVEISTPGLIKVVNDFLESRKSDEFQDKLLEKYMDDLQVDTPDELKTLLDTVNNNSAEVLEVRNNDTSEK